MQFKYCLSPYCTPGIATDDLDTPKLGRADMVGLSSGSDSDSFPTTEEGEGSSQEDLDHSTASSLDELPLTPKPHPLVTAVKVGGVACLSGNKKSGQKSATKDFLLRLFEKKAPPKDDHVNMTGKMTSLIPARNSPRDIDKVRTIVISCSASVHFSWVMCVD